MKITVINGNLRHGSTWNCVHAVLDNLQKREQLEVREFNLPRDMPHFCNGCFSCIYNGEDECPHRESIRPIADALLSADLIILASPVYGMDVSGQMKAVIDHLCYMWMSHRPESAMFHKVGLTVTTSAGAGLGHTTKTMKKSLVFWGAKKVHTFKFPVSAMRWSDVTEHNKAKIERKVRKLSIQISKSVHQIHRLPSPLFRSFFFWLMTGMQKKNDWNLTDRSHWEKHGWLAGSRPF